MNKLNKRVILLLTVSIFGIFGNIKGQSAEELVRLALENNPEIMSRNRSYEAMKEKVGQVALPDPMVTLGYFVSPVETRLGPQQFNAMASQQFPWFGTLKSQRNVAQLMAESKYSQLIDLQNRIAYSVIENYEAWQNLNSQQEILKENIELMESVLRLVTQKVESGKAAVVDVLQIEMELNALRTSLKNLGEMESPLKAKMEMLAGTTVLRPKFSPNPVINTRIEFSLNDSIWDANPRIEALSLEMESQREMKNVAKKMGSPGFTLGANYINVGERTDMNPPGNGTDAIMFPQVGIRLPLQRKKYTAMKREAQLNEEAILFTQQNLKNQLRVEAEMAVRNYNTALRNYSLASEQQILVEKGIDLMIASFSTGKKSLEDLVQLQRKKIEFENLKAKSVYEGNAQSAFLKYLLAY